MAKGIIGGMTDYSHQSFQDILNDIAAEKERTVSFRNEIQKNVEILTTNSYWNSHVPSDFQSMISYALRHYSTAIDEFDDMYRDIDNEVKEHHVKRLKRISTVAQEINVEIGRIWHQRYYNKDYGNEDFRIVETIYEDTRDMAVNLLDISNIADRLDDYIGKINPNNMKKNNPWISGSFYVFLALIVIAGLATLSKAVHWTILPIIIIGGILIIGLIGVLQLKNDGQISDKSFVHLVSETYKRLPLLGNKKNK